MAAPLNRAEVKEIAALAGAGLSANAIVRKIRRSEHAIRTVLGKLRAGAKIDAWLVGKRNAPARPSRPQGPIAVAIVARINTASTLTAGGPPILVSMPAIAFLDRPAFGDGEAVERGEEFVNPSTGARGSATGTLRPGLPGRPSFFPTGCRRPERAAALRGAVP